jgi:hypothetical protein
MSNSPILLYLVRSELVSDTGMAGREKSGEERGSRGQFLEKLVPFC